MATKKISGILLAAGSSTRFGSNKLCHQLENGQAMVVVSALAMQQCSLDCWVVVREDDMNTQQLLQQHDINYLRFADASHGMGATLSFAVRQLSSSDAWLIGLADMPFVSPATIDSVLTNLQSGSPLVAPYYSGRRGHPVGFSAQFFEPLSQLTGDKGGNSILKANEKLLKRIDVEDAGCVHDIDTPADLRM